MEHFQLPVDEPTAARLKAANGATIEVQGPNGEVVGYFVSPSRMAKIEEEHKAVVAWLDQIWPPEEMARIRERLKDETRPKRTTAEVMQLFEEHRCSP